MERGRGLATGISARLNAKELRKFGLTVALPFGLLAALTGWRGHAISPVLFGGLAAVLGGLALLAPRALAPIERLWMGAAHVLGWFNTRLIMGVVYFLVMTPTGIIMRLVGRDPLNRRLMDRPSYWVKRTESRDPRASMERQF